MGIIDLIFELVANIIFDVRSILEPALSFKFILIIFIVFMIIFGVIKQWFLISFFAIFPLIWLIKNLRED